MTSYWLCKTEPTTYSISDLQREKVTQWDGVRNYQARNNLRSMKNGDRVLIYHSGSEPVRVPEPRSARHGTRQGIVGLARVVKEAYPDPLQFNKKSKYFDPKSSAENPRWLAPDLKLEEEFSRPLALKELKQLSHLKEMELFKSSRLSVQKLTAKEFETIVELKAQDGA